MTNYVKYPSTPFLPWARPDNDGKIIQTLDYLEGDEVVITEKMDGENTTMYSDHIHARSLDSVNHPSRNWVKGKWGADIRYNLPLGWRVCGENMFAKHSIAYTDLEDFFLGFSIWNDKNECLDWDETLSLFEEWNITPVPTLWRGKFDIGIIKDKLHPFDETKQEGYVVRSTGRYTFSEFPFKIAKYVRKNHVQTGKHWMRGWIIPNKVK